MSLPLRYIFLCLRDRHYVEMNVSVIVFLA